jgi:hypothetical protein
MSTWKTSLLATACLGLSMGIATDPRADTGSVKDELLHAISLEGHPCGEVTEEERQALADYTVTCADGSRYRVRITAYGRLEVSNLDRPDTGAPASHDAIVKKMLTAVIHVAGSACGAVVTVVRMGAQDHLATCLNDRRYRVHLELDGRVAVTGQETQ